MPRCLARIAPLCPPASILGLSWIALSTVSTGSAQDGRRDTAVLRWRFREIGLLDGFYSQAKNDENRPE
jgi:hypothetical protein